MSISESLRAIGELMMTRDRKHGYYQGFLEAMEMVQSQRSEDYFKSRGHQILMVDALQKRIAQTH